MGMKQVYVGAHTLDAELVRGLLESRGIHAVVRGAALFSLRGEVPMTAETLPTVWVDESDHQRVREIIEDYHGGGTASRVGARAWVCPRCREWLEPQFTSCWRCV
ncbi:MAG: DUF2007 domain-containing protein [Deltaproteobacteria bacterium]|nr:DUF2007 domain-containing protein [Deltaproteobacteria bacterium]